ncbi:ribbon-helix-helix domain-containing protein [Kovacikia minuta CCNUW1]|uniref:ribbon-helix-helix domain-containing protein n=1 Tax=Kovacikia minuta TaxID=2931930 RepID=UPI001CCD6FE6|nr:ribbon-helix-helix domain-containing protein [Kovacikia minuta]UBF26049.1 ribbon-helix-helix domain-containing protein [Kovacikia minuta CCNUW1]
MENQNISTTFNLPSDLLAATDQAVQSGKAKSRDEFVALALRHELAALKRTEIDVALAEMASDPDYQAEVLQMESEFANAQWEAKASIGRSV